MDQNNNLNLTPSITPAQLNPPSENTIYLKIVRNINRFVCVPVLETLLFNIQTLDLNKNMSNETKIQTNRPLIPLAKHLYNQRGLIYFLNGSFARKVLQSANSVASLSFQSSLNDTIGKNFNSVGEIPTFSFFIASSFYISGLLTIFQPIHNLTVLKICDPIKKNKQNFSYFDYYKKAQKNGVLRDIAFSGGRFMFLSRWVSLISYQKLLILKENRQIFWDDNIIFYLSMTLGYPFQMISHRILMAKWWNISLNSSKNATETTQKKLVTKEIVWSIVKEKKIFGLYYGVFLYLMKLDILSSPLQY